MKRIFVEGPRLSGALTMVLVLAALVLPVSRAEQPVDAFQQLVDQLRAHPEDTALRERIIAASREQTPAPAIPEQARRFFIRGNTALEDAQGAEGYQRAGRNFDEALKIAPWWGEAYRNLAKSRELAKEYSGAMDALKLYLLTGPAAADARQAQDRIYALEEKRDWAQERRDAKPQQPVPAAEKSASKFAFAEDENSPGTVIRDCSKCPELVVINATYAMGKYPVTQKQWRDLMGSNPSYFQNCGDDCPVEHVSWNDVQDYLVKLNEKTGKGYRLPTQEQWEYVCHADSPTEFCGSAQSDAVAWFLRNSGARTHPVGQKQPNGLGLYDMNGNVWEWTNDCAGKECGARVLVGGSWSFDPQFAGARRHISVDPTTRLNDYGFRVTRPLH